MTATLTVQQVATLKGVSVQSVRDALKSGKFPGAVFIGENKYRGEWQIPEADVSNWQPRKYPRQSAP